MAKKKNTKRNVLHLGNPLYLNANLIYSAVINKIREKEGRTLSKLRKQYGLSTSILTRFEVIQRLRLKHGKNIDEAREMYNSILTDYEIVEISSIHKYPILTDDFLDKLASSNLGFRDALHLCIAKKHGMKVCTHDKKMLKNYSQHGDKAKFYNQVYKPQDLIETKK